MKTILAILIFAVSLGAQVTPFVQSGVVGSGENGYTRPNAFVQPGIEVDARRITSISNFDYEPWVQKDHIAGFGYMAGARTENYFRLSKRWSIGGGVNYKYLKTPIFNKYAIWAVGGAMVDFKSARLYLDYFEPLIDQNRNIVIEARAEYGKGRIRPIIIVGGNRFLESSYCSTACTVHGGPTYAGGFKIMLGHFQATAK